MIDEIKVIMNCPITRRYIYGIFIQQFHPLIALKYILKIIILIIKCKIYQKENFIEIFKKITGESYLAIIKKNTKKNMVAFFYPQVTLRDHFDEIQNNLENLGIKTINLYGTIKNDLLENKANSFYVGAPSDFFSLKRLDFINFFVTPSVVDCFPPNSTKILIDHLSYATFRPVSMDSINDRMNHDFLMKKYEYFFKLIVIYDHIFLPNILRKNFTIQMLSLHGYSKKNQRINEKNKISFFLDKYLINDGQKIRQKIFLHELGYPKLDRDFSKYKTQKK